MINERGHKMKGAKHTWTICHSAGKQKNKVRVSTKGKGLEEEVKLWLTLMYNSHKQTFHFKLRPQHLTLTSTPPPSCSTCRHTNTDPPAAAVPPGVSGPFERGHTSEREVRLEGPGFQLFWNCGRLPEEQWRGAQSLAGQRSADQINIQLGHINRLTSTLF